MKWLATILLFVSVSVSAFCPMPPAHYRDPTGVAQQQFQMCVEQERYQQQLMDMQQQQLQVQRQQLQIQQQQLQEQQQFYRSSGSPPMDGAVNALQYNSTGAMRGNAFEGLYNIIRNRQQRQ